MMRKTKNSDQTQKKERLAAKESSARTRQKSFRLPEELACKLELHATVRRLRKVNLSAEVARVEAGGSAPNRRKK